MTPIPADPLLLDIDLAAGTVRVEVRGPASAPLLLCVPGLSANLRSVDAIAAGAATAGRRVAAVDLRGRGRSPATAAGTYGWEAHARDVLELASVLGAETFDLCGHSMGGFVAMQAAAIDGARLRRVVTVDALGIPEPASMPPIRTAVERLGNTVASREEYLEARRSVGAIVPWRPLWTEYFLYELEDVPGGVRPITSRDAVAEDLAYGDAADPGLFWPALTMPVLLVRASLPIVPGAGHIVASADIERARAAVPMLRVVEVEASHYTVVDDPRTVSAILEFLA